MKIKQISSSGTFLDNPNANNLMAADRNRDLAQVTLSISTNSNQPLFNISVQEYFESKTITIDNPEYVPPHQTEQSNSYEYDADYPWLNNPMYLYETEPGPLQTQIIITIPHIDQNTAKVHLDRLVSHLSKDFYIYTPYAYVVRADYYNKNSFLRIRGMRPVLEDTIWEGLRSSSLPGLQFSDELIDQLKAYTYPKMYVPSEAAIYAKIRQHITAQEYELAVEYAISIGNAKDKSGYYVSSTADYLYQTGIWLEQVGQTALPHALRAYRALLENDAHALQKLAKQRITIISSAKLNDDNTSPGMTYAWHASRLNALGLDGATATPAAQSAALDSMFIMATQNYAVAETQEGAKYTAALEAEFNKLKNVKFQDDSGIGLGIAMMKALLDTTAKVRADDSEEEKANPKARTSPQI